MLSRLIPVLLLSVTCSATTVNTFYSESAFDDVIGSASFITESFAGNQINTPGLSVSACFNPSYPSGGAKACNQLSTTQLNEGLHYFQYITQNMFTDAVGRNPSNPYSGNFGTNAFSTIFTLPKSVTAVGFDVDESSYLASAFGITVGAATEYPFGGFLPDFPNLPADGYPYDGFIGFVSDTPFNTIEFSGFYNPGVHYTLDNLTFGDPTPEPASIWITAAGLGLLLLRRRRNTRRGEPSAP